LDQNKKELACTRSDEIGNYAFEVTANEKYFIRVLAELNSESTQGCKKISTPSKWHFFITNKNNILYSYTSSIKNIQNKPFKTSDIILAGHFVNTKNQTLKREEKKTYKLTRESAPFAILDTIYTGKRFIETIEPSSHFKPLQIKWSPTIAITKYYSDNITQNRILTLSGKIDIDADEYDQHVILDYWGRYFFNDSLQWSTQKSQLWGFLNGWSYALSGIILKNPYYYNSTGNHYSTKGFTSNGSVWDLEKDSLKNLNSTTKNANDPLTIASIIYDFFDIHSDTPEDVFTLSFSDVYLAMRKKLTNNNDTNTNIGWFVQLLISEGFAIKSQIIDLLTAKNITQPSIDALRERSNLFSSIDGNIKQPIQKERYIWSNKPSIFYYKEGVYNQTRILSLKRYDPKKYHHYTIMIIDKNGQLIAGSSTPLYADTHLNIPTKANQTYTIIIKLALKTNTLMMYQLTFQ
jgi:hypothetical protein